MVREMQLKVAEAKQRDIGRGKARLDSDGMQALGITAGDIIQITGKRETAAVAWPAYPEDQGKRIIRIDGILRRNAGVALNEYVIVKSVEAKEAQSVVLAPIDMRLNIDQDFTGFVKNRLIELPLVEGDSVFVMIMGSAIPFSVVRVKPRGIVKMTQSTTLQVLSEPTPEKKGIPRVTYEDIGGLHEEIRRLREMVELPLRHPELFQRLGIEPPKGVLLHGPPGCGKTLLAKAVANESAANFFSINGPEIMSKFYGESEKRLRQSFQKAQENAPSIIFIDELDAIAPKREEVSGEVERRVVAQLLALMDGLEARGDVIVIGATNRVNAIDPALRRPGRFDREIEIVVPDKNGRFEILQIHTRGMPLSESVDLTKLRNMTHGYTGADIAALAREAAMKSLRRYLPEINLEEERVSPQILEKMEVNMDDFLEAFREITPTAMREVYIEVPTTSWSEVGGLDETKELLKESVEWPIKSPELFSIKGPEVFSKWVGESEKAIREIFRKGRTAAPSVIFIDELDSIVPRRGIGYADSGVSERVISQLLTELDGLVSLQNVVVIGATNRPDIIDPALLRPGRFDRLIYVPAPDEKSRLEIFQIYTKKMPLADDVNIEELVKNSKGYSGADIESICREAAMNALRRNIEEKKVKGEDFDKAIAKSAASITPEMEKWYQNQAKQFKRQTVKPATHVA